MFFVDKRLLRRFLEYFQSLYIETTVLLELFDHEAIQKPEVSRGEFIRRVRINPHQHKRSMTKQ